MHAKHIRAEMLNSNTICDELGVDVQLMPVCESINEADDVRLRNTSALDPRGGAKV